MLKSSPFNQASNSVTQLMLQVILATLPGALIMFYFFGWGVLFNLLTCSLVAMASEAAILKLRGRDFKSGLSDYSALVTGILIGLALPPLAPWWVAVIGTFFAITFAKHVYGGLGYNPFNPAMVGYVLLLISFPVAMTSWLPPQNIATNAVNFLDSLNLFLFEIDSQGNKLNFYLQNADGFTMATPLDELKTGLSMGFTTAELQDKLILTGWVNQGWQWVNIAFLVGGLYLLTRKVIHWYIPVGMLGAIFLTSGLLTWIDPDLHISPMTHLFSGATMLGAFFIATDPVSAATTPKGRIIFGAGIGFLVVIIRNFGGYPDAVAFAVLLLNMAAPLIDHFTQPKVYGTRDA
ncbi:MAG: electron transport complex subunit RsxD [Gammaproteobacteria bacterium]|nr:electron transport complex subunit RsxD [Gammaproteobacteria bacterium]